MRPILLLTDPENRRTTFFVDAVRNAGGPPLEVLSWAEFVVAPHRLVDRIEDETRPRPVGLRIETPGESATLAATLIRLGAEISGAPAIAPAADRLAGGEVVAPQFWAAGLDHLLGLISDVVEQTQIPVLNHPAELRLALDKRRCQQTLADAGVAVPRLLPAFGSGAELLELMDAERLSRIFVKPSGGSSASCVVAVRRSDTLAQAITSAELVDEGGTLRVYNSLRMRNYRGAAAVVRLIDRLSEFDLYAEEWVPKASAEGGVFDLRVVTIGGRARHAVMRVSRSPMTNLHLGNRRGDLDAWRAQAGPAVWESIEQIAERVATCFPRCLALGIDIGVTSRTLEPVVFEVNGFGDLLPNLTHDGQTVPDAIWNAWRVRLPAV